VKPDLHLSPTDRGTWRVVAARDFRVRLHDRGFLISTTLTVAILSIFILIRAYGGGGTPSYDLGYIGDGALAQRTAQISQEQGTTVRVKQVSDTAAADAALKDGSLDVVLEPGPVIVARTDPPPDLVDSINLASASLGIEGALSKAGVPADQIVHLLQPQPVPVHLTKPTNPQRQENAGYALVIVLLLYGQLFGYGVWVATGVIEEKSSRVVEILLSSIRSRQLLAGKVFGIGALGLVQLTCIAVFAIVLGSATGALQFPVHAIGAAAVALTWFVFGFMFYASLFAVAGSLVSRMEELQNAIVPLNLVVLTSLIISISTVSNPSSSLAIAASLVPFSSALAMPVRIALGAATIPQIVASLAILIGSAAAMIPLSGRLYSGAVLRTGAKVKLRDAWRAAA
jgi:ABC-2 type transport system permease protein